MTSSCLAILLLLALPVTTLAQRSPARRQPIIDVYLHNYSTDELLKNQAPNPVTGKPNGLETEEAHMRATLAAMDRYHIVKGLVSNNYDLVRRWEVAAPGKILPSYGFDDPAQPNLNFLRNEIVAGRIKALGEIGNQYEGVGPNDPKMEPYFALAEELDVPIAIHMGLGPPGAAYVGYPKYRMSLSNPLLLEDVLIRHPKLRLYVMHAGWPMIDEVIGLLWAHPHVYVDVAVINWAIPRAEFHAYLRRLVDAGFSKRIMFGSDQMVWPEAIGMAVDGIQSATFLTAEQKRDIFYNNAAQFLRLDKQEAAGEVRAVRRSNRSRRRGRR